MAVSLVGYKRSYVGLSTDEKPVSTATDIMPAGSTFFEADKTRTAKWDGYHWFYAVGDAAEVDTAKKLDELLAVASRALIELQLLNEKF